MEMQITEYTNYNCYVINLDRFPKKLEFMKQQLEKQDISYQIFSAIDGEKIDSAYLTEHNLNYSKDWKEPYSGRMITVGEIGCAVSHYFIYQLCQKQPYDITLILEDDAVLDKNFNDKLQHIIDDLQTQPWDLCYLGRKKMQDDTEAVSDYLVTPSYSYWTIGYLINKSAASKICNSGFSKNILTIDEFLPIIGNISPHTQYNENFTLPKDFKILSAKKLIIHPTPDAFQTSSTEISKFPEIQEKSDKIDLLVLAVGTDMTHGLERFIRSCKVYGLHHKILGLHSDWKGGNMAKGMGGGMKVNLLRTELNTLNEEQLVLFTDSYDVIMTTNEEEIIQKFNKFNTPVVFSAERSCWPDTNLKSQYPKTSSVYTYLNSGGFIGKVKDLQKILHNSIADHDDDQLYYTTYFLKHQDEISLDYHASIFQTLNYSINDLEIVESKGRIKNTLYQQYPCQIHGNGGLNIKIKLNSFGNYLSRNWNDTYGYLQPKKIPDSKHSPSVFISVYLDKLFLLEDLLKNLLNLDYKKDLLEIHFFCTYESKEKSNNLQEFMSNNISKYRHITIHSQIDVEPKNRDNILKTFIASKCQYWLVIDRICCLQNPKIIQSLLSYKKDIIAPYFPRGNEYYSNFWGAIGKTGFYERSFDYYDIVENNKKGCWNVPYINYIYLVTKKLAEKCTGFYSKNYNPSKGHDMAWCENLREAGHFMYVANEESYGILINEEEYLKENLFFDLYLYKNNEDNWAKKYFHPEFYQSINNWKNLHIDEPLSDVIVFPLFNETFCQEIISVSESYNKWSCASHNDSRIGYENVPTNDIHLSEMKLREVWNSVVLRYIAPLVSYYWSPFKTKGLNISFIVKYIADKFYDLKPHHDASTYSIVVTLNRPGIDFKGGGTRFVKQDVTVEGQIGYATIHPGRLTHYHEGLAITEGERYIFVSFVD